MILILRTFAHNKNWEKEKNLCLYDFNSYKIIKEWEPDIVTKINKISCAIGLYNPLYYTYSGVRGYSFTQTPDEEHPSIINLENISDNDKNHVTDNGYELNIQYKLVTKIPSINRKQMLAIDKMLVDEKVREAGIKKYNYGYSSLCFTLSKDFVKSVFAKYNYQIPDEGLIRKPVF